MAEEEVKTAPKEAKEATETKKVAEKVEKVEATAEKAEKTEKTEKAEKAEATKAETTTVAKSKKGKKAKRIVNAGAVHIQSTFNNTIITVTDKLGGVLSASSAGANGFRGSKKGTAFAAGVAAEKALDTAKKNHSLNSVDVYVKGIGLGRDAAVRAISAAGIKIDSISDVTPIQHGGVRPKGERKP